jgi:hypothetical protein
MAAALAYAFIAGAIGVALRRFARATPFAIAVLVLLPLLLSGQALLTGGVYGAIDLAYTSEPLASVAESAGVTHVVNPIASDIYTEFIPWHAAVRDAIRHHQWPLWDPFALCGTALAGAVQSAPYHPLHLIALVLPLPAALTFIATALFFIAAVSMFLFVRPLVSSDEPALVAAAIWMLAPHVGGYALTAYALALSTMPLVLLAARHLARTPSLRHALLLAMTLAVTILAGHPETTLHVVTIAIGYFFVERWRAHDKLWGRAIPLGFLAGGLALLLTAFSLLPFIEAVRQTSEARERQTFVFVSWRATRSLHAARDSLLPAPLARYRSNREEVPGTAYAGSLALALALLGFYRRRDWFFAAVFFFGLLAAVRTALFSDALRVIPLFSISANEHLAWYCSLALAVLAAIGLDGATRRQLAVALIAVAILFAIVVAPDVLSATAIRALLPLAIAAGAALVIRSPRAAAVSILLLCILQRGGETAPFRTWVPRSAFFPPFHGLELFHADEPFRIVGQRSILPPNLAAHYRLEDTRGYQAMTLERFASVEPYWSIPQPTWSNRVETLDSPFFSLMNVRFALVKQGRWLPASWQVLAHFDGYDVVENRRVLSRAFVPATVHAGVTRSEAFQGVETCGDFGDNAWIEGGERGTRLNGPGVVATREIGSKLDMYASMRNDGWIVISESAWNGWQAVIDGKPAQVRIADATFLGVYVPRGEHHVRLVYQPLSFVIGGGISVATMLLVAAVALLRLRR